jgi:hypothetical protein
VAISTHISQSCESIGWLLPIAVSKPGIMGMAACGHSTTEVVITIVTAIRCARSSV